MAKLVQRRQNRLHGQMSLDLKQLFAALIARLLKPNDCALHSCSAMLKKQLFLYKLTLESTSQPRESSVRPVFNIFTHHLATETCSVGTARIGKPMTSFGESTNEVLLCVRMIELNL